MEAPGEVIEIEEVITDDVLVDGVVVEHDVTVRQIDIEGNIHPWDKDTITSEEIAVLGKWTVAEGVLIIDEDNCSRTLEATEVVVVEHGVRFCKKVKFKRGWA